MDIALAKMDHLRSQAQLLMSKTKSSSLLGHSSTEPHSTPIASCGQNLSIMHGLILSHPHDIPNKLHKLCYSSQPPITGSPDMNVCKLISYRGAKIAAFTVDGRELLCLPQAFELFLKHLVGGLHTVYTKLKRLDIIPIICNVEQVRVLRGLGAIQPGVNRCKLITCNEFDILYEDCTNSSARPGRPPKRSPSLHASPENPSLYASPETIDKLKKLRFDGVDFYSASRFLDSAKYFLNSFPPHPYTMGHLPFLQLNHPLLAPPITLAMTQQLKLRHERFLSKVNYANEQDRVRDSDDDKDRSLPKQCELSFPPTHEHMPTNDIDDNTPLNLHINGHADNLLNSPNSRSDEPITHDNNIDGLILSDEDNLSEGMADREDFLDTLSQSELGEVAMENQHIQSNRSNGTLPGYATIETLLINIQGLLTLAGENAKHQERQITDLKSDLIQEKKTKDDLETQLLEEQKQKNILLRRLKKERRVRRHLEERGRDISRSHLTKKIENCNSTDKMNKDHREINCHLQEIERTFQTKYSSV